MKRAISLLAIAVLTATLVAPAPSAEAGSEIDALIAISGAALVVSIYNAVRGPQAAVVIYPAPQPVTPGPETSPSPRQPQASGASVANVPVIEGGLTVANSAGFANDIFVNGHLRRAGMPNGEVITFPIYEGGTVLARAVDGRFAERSFSSGSAQTVILRASDFPSR